MERTFGLSRSNIEIIGITVGSVRIEFRVLPDPANPLVGESIQVLLSDNAVVGPLLQLYTNVTGDVSSGVVSVGVVAERTESSTSSGRVIIIAACLAGCAFLAVAVAVRVCLRRGLCWWGAWHFCSRSSCKPSSLSWTEHPSPEVPHEPTLLEVVATEPIPRTEPFGESELHQPSTSRRLVPRRAAPRIPRRYVAGPQQRAASDVDPRRAPQRVGEQRTFAAGGEHLQADGDKLPSSLIPVDQSSVVAGPPASTCAQVTCSREPGDVFKETDAFSFTSEEDEGYTEWPAALETPQTPRTNAERDEDDEEYDCASFGGVVVNPTVAMFSRLSLGAPRDDDDVFNPLANDGLHHASVHVLDAPTRPLPLSLDRGNHPTHHYRAAEASLPQHAAVELPRMFRLPPTAVTGIGFQDWEASYSSGYSGDDDSYILPPFRLR